MMRAAWESVLMLGLLGGLSGCGGGVTEKEKEAAEKVPSLDVGETDSAASDATTSDDGAAEMKESPSGEAKKP